MAVEVFAGARGCRKTGLEMQKATWQGGFVCKGLQIELTDRVSLVERRYPAS